MDDAMKKFLNQAEELKKLASGADVMEKFRNSGLALEAMQSAAFKKIDFPDVIHAAPMRMPKIPTAEESNSFQSSGALLRRLADSITQWRAQLPEDVQPAVLAILHGGVQIEVDRLAQESFHGIRVEGRIQGSPCVVLAHQATVQLLCFIEPIKPPERPRRPIGFIIDGAASEA